LLKLHKIKLDRVQNRGFVLSFGPQEDKITQSAKGWTLGLGASKNVITPSISAYNHPVTLNFPDVGSLAKSIEETFKAEALSAGSERDSLSSELYDSADWDKLIDFWRNGEEIIPECVRDLIGQNSRVPYPAIGDFVGSFRPVEGSYTVLRSKFNNLDIMKKPKLLGPNDLTRVMVSRPMQEPKRNPDCGEIRATGEYKVTLNYDGKGQGYGYKALYQKRACHCSACSVCGEKNILDDAWLYSQDIWARVNRLKVCGSEAHVYEWVFSPPQATLEEFRETIKTIMYKEGQTEYERLISFVIRNVTGDLDATATGWSIFYHPWRQNGKDGAHRPWDGNDSDPYHHRVSPHYHVIVVSWLRGPALIKKLNALKEEHPFLKDWTITIGPNKEDKKKAKAQGKRHAPPHEIADRHELEHKLAYILSHTGIKQKTDEEGNPTGRRLPMVSHHGLNHYKRMSRLTFRSCGLSSSDVPLLSQGYEEIVSENGTDRPVYWANYLYPCIANGKSLYYAHVERINSAHVYVSNFDKENCRADLIELIRAFREGPSGRECPERLLSRIYNHIRADDRYIFDFTPQEGAVLRYPYRLYLKAGERDLWNLINSEDGPPCDIFGNVSEDDISPRSGGGQGVPDMRSIPQRERYKPLYDDSEDWRDGLDDYALRYGRGCE